ncbi:ATP-binding cassette domain-containing protein [Dehalogenimonas sp. THU2]|uniref:ATP-binding cassette domain-containing protein n=1 Tax=Dehalogenimonas sp. THU2 TaxID=3151121 RepID=UPI003218AAF7
MLVIEDLSVNAGAFKLREINLEIKTGEYLVLLGPTGSGKTVLLETIAGLRRPERGTIRRDGTNLCGLNPEERGLSLVYQDQMLFPHLTVHDNVCFGLKMQRRSRDVIEASLDRICQLINIEHLLGRRPGTLSGGERQNVALARSLITSPWLLLLDEPFSSMDASLRRGSRAHMKKLQRELGFTCIHVTHDLEEAMDMADRIAFILDGRLARVGSPENFLLWPDLAFKSLYDL